MTSEQRDRRPARFLRGDRKDFVAGQPMPERKSDLVRILAKSKSLVTVQVLILFFCVLATLVAYCLLVAAGVRDRKATV